MPQITKELAERIVKKLKADVNARPGRPHDLALVFEDGRLIASFGLRRGSKKNQGHDHIPDSLHITPRQAKLLAQCPLSRMEWIEILKQKELF